MVGAQQLSIAPGQLTQIQPGQLTSAPGVYVATQESGGIGEMLNAIMPLIMIMMVFMMITPMMKGMAEGFKK
ncbi:cell division protein FtsH [Chloroflexota bacterium]